MVIWLHYQQWNGMVIWLHYQQWEGMVIWLHYQQWDGMVKWLHYQQWAGHLGTLSAIGCDGQVVKLSPVRRSCGFMQYVISTVSMEVLWL